MSTLARTARPWIVALGVGAAASIAAFVMLPEALLGSPATVLQPLRPSLAALWDGGDDALPPALTDLVGYWREWHAIKVSSCALLLTVAIVGALIFWSRFRAAQRGRGVGDAVAGTTATVLAVIGGGLLALNVQATVVPLVALLPLVSVGGEDDAVGRSLGQLRDALATEQTMTGHDRVTQLLIDQVWHYTAINAVLMALLAVVTGWLAVALLVRFSRSLGDRRARIACAATGPFLAVSALGFAAVSTLSVVSALDAGSTAAGLLGG